MKIVSIDPGSHRTGYAVFEISKKPPRMTECGVIFVKGKDLPERLLSVHRGIERLFRRQRPKQVVIEQVFVGKNAKAAMTLASARAICMLAAAAVRARVFDYSPTQVKKAVWSTARAGKGTIQRAVQLQLALRELPPSDAADAIALGLCHLHR